MKHADPNPNMRGEIAPATLRRTERKNHPLEHIRKAKRGWLRRVAYRLKTWLQQRRAVRELEALSDRQLEDIGLTRAQVEGLAAGRLRLRDLQPQRGHGTPGTCRQTHLGVHVEQDTLSSTNSDRKSAA